MATKLVKTETTYHLVVNDKIIGSLGDSDGKLQKLSKENCDEIFGVVDVEKLAYKTYEPETFVNHSDMYKYLCIKFFKEGFNKAMELNKDKLFTIEDMYEAIRKAKSYDEIPNHDGVIVSFDYSKEEIIQSLQQPTEMEVEIEMDDIYDGIDSARIFTKEETIVPKLDKNGCIVLRKK